MDDTVARSLRPATLLLSAPSEAPPLRPHAPPLYQTVSFESADLAELDQAVLGQRYFYARHGAPNEAAAAELLARLEGGGAVPDAVEALLFSSGMAAIEAAITAAVDSITRSPGGPPPAVLVASPLYSAARVLFRALSARGMFTLFEQDTPDIAAATAFVERASAPIAAIYCEVLTNPQLRIPDIDALSALAARCGAALIVDATMATPLFCRPLSRGASLVVHSATKFLAGHGDVCAGVVAGRPELCARARAFRQLHGAILEPFSAWLLQRSLRTLAVRLHKQVDNAVALAQYLEENAAALGIEQVIYPGLKSHPDYALAQKLFDRPGAMLSFVVKSEAAARRAYERVSVLRRVASLGDVESLIMYPAATWSRSLSPADLARQGISLGLLRVSVGIEDIADLIFDLRRALSE